MKYILIDTSKPNVLVVLGEDEKVLGQDSWAGDKTLSTKLLSAIDALLKKNNVPWADVERLAVHRGPGHYSALRTGITTATFLAMGKDIPLVQVEGEMLEELMKQARENKPVTVVVPKYGDEIRND